MEEYFNQNTGNLEFVFEIGDKTYGTYVAVEWLFVNLQGDIVSLEHDTSQYRGGGACIYTPQTENFDAHVRYFFEKLLKENKEEFIKLRGKLNSRWKSVAESVRKDAIAAFDF